MQQETDFTIMKCRWVPVQFGSRFNWLLLTGYWPKHYFRFCRSRAWKQNAWEVFRPACLQSWLEFNFAGMPAAKTSGYGSSCQRRNDPICRNSIPGSTGGFVEGRSAAYENQAFIKFRQTRSETWRPNSHVLCGRKRHSQPLCISNCGWNYFSISLRG